MSKVLVRLFNSGLVVVITAILAGLASMTLLYFIFIAIWGDEPASTLPGEAPPQTVEEGQAEPLESFFLLAEAVPAPFLSRDDGSILGYVFLNVTIEVRGEEAYSRGQGAMDAMIQAFTRELKNDGVGKANQPGVIDYDRLAETLLAVAGDEVGRANIAEVRITGSESELAQE